MNYLSIFYYLFAFFPFVSRLVSFIGCIFVFVRCAVSIMGRLSVVSVR